MKLDYKKVYDDIYLIEIPLRGNPLKSLNCFIVKSQGASLIVDCGFNTEENQEFMKKIIKDLDLDLDRTSLFLTHLHSDHTGLASFLEKMGVKVYISKIDGYLVENGISPEGEHWRAIYENGMLQGLSKDNVTLQTHPGFKYRPKEEINYIAVEPGDVLAIGDYKFEVIDLIGHTPGIVGLYEKKHKILFCGDHILGKITPNITFWGFKYGDMLGKYLESLDKVYDMDVKHLFSSHRFLVEDHKARIEEIKNHHKARLEETVQVLKKHGTSTVRDITKNLSWDIRSKNWDDFPNSQKWFAAGEAHAHLERLRSLGIVDYKIKNRIIYYFLID